MHLNHNALWKLICQPPSETEEALKGAENGLLAVLLAAILRIPPALTAADL